MNTILSEPQFNNIVNNKIGKTGYINTEKEILFMENKDFFIYEEPNKDDWLLIHSNKLVDKNKNSYLQYLLEQEPLSDIPFKLFKITDVIDTNKTCYNSGLGGVSFLTLSKIRNLTYQLYLNFQNGTEYMINLNEDNKYFLIFDKPNLINWYRIRVLPTGKYLFYISRNYLNFLLHTHDANGKMDEIMVSIIKNHQIQSGQMYDMLKDNIITSTSFPVQNENVLTNEFHQFLQKNTFEHQLDNIKWIMYIEKLSSLDMTRMDYINTQGMIEVKLNREYYYTNHSYYHIYNKDSLTKTPRHEMLSFKGGVLADEAGMGKTRSIISVILADISYNQYITINGGLLNTLLPKYVKPDKKIDIKNDNDEDTLLSHYYQLIESNDYSLGQTLVIAPSHVIDIWQEEISEMDDKSIKYMTLSNMTHIKKLIPDMISHYNLIILSNTLIVNKKYQELIQTKPEYDFNKYLWHRIVVDEASDILRLETNNYHLDTKTATIQKYLNNMDSMTRWCLTASPFQYKESNLGGYIKFLTGDDNKDIISNLDNSDIKKMCRNYFRRHDKKEITDLPIPKIKRECVLLKQSGIEKAIYQSALHKYNKTRLMQLCTHVQISEEETKILNSFDGHKIMPLAEIESSMLSYYTNKIKDLEKEIKELISMDENDKKMRQIFIDTINKQYLDEDDKNIKIGEMANIIKSSTKVQYIYSLLDDYLNSYTIQKALNSLDNCDVPEIYTVLHINQEIATKHQEVFNNKIKENEREINTLKNQMGLFKQNYITESVKEPCYICYEHFDKVIITECRHIFCGRCLKSLFGTLKNRPCPVCRRNINKDTIKVTDMKLIKKAEYQNLKDEDIKKYGTKIAFLIQKTRQLLEDEDNKIIVFSQWPSMLKLISNVLTEFNIKHLTSKGNISSIKSNMNKFENNDIRVLLLNPDDCIIGNDLTIATHIIMTDVLMMTKSKAKTIEDQLLGYIQRIGENKEINLIKLVTAGTIEEEYYRKQKQHLDNI